MAPAPEPVGRAHMAFLTGLFFALGFVLGGGTFLCGWVTIAAVATTAFWLPLRGAVWRMSAFAAAWLLGVAAYVALAPPMPPSELDFWVVGPLTDQAATLAVVGGLILLVRRVRSERA